MFEWTINVLRLYIGRKDGRSQVLTKGSWRAVVIAADGNEVQRKIEAAFGSETLRLDSRNGYEEVPSLDFTMVSARELPTEPAQPSPEPRLRPRGYRPSGQR